MSAPTGGREQAEISDPGGGVQRVKEGIPTGPRDVHEGDVGGEVRPREVCPANGAAGSKSSTADGPGLLYAVPSEEERNALTRRPRRGDD